MNKRTHILLHHTHLGRVSLAEMVESEAGQELGLALGGAPGLIYKPPSCTRNVHVP